jgi:hypothetical protein
MPGFIASAIGKETPIVSATTMVRAAKISHSGTGDRAEEGANLEQNGNPNARLKADVNDAAFSTRAENHVRRILLHCQALRSAGPIGLYYVE